MAANSIVHSILGERLRILRKRRQLTLTGLAERSGISKSSLSVLEDGRGNPTISTIWRLADALKVPFGELAKFSPSDEPADVEDQGVSVRLIEQSLGAPLIETYLMRLEPNSSREAEPHSLGVSEQVRVLKGKMLVGNYKSPRAVSVGEDYEFKGDCVHVYQSLDEPATAVISIKYPDEDQERDLFTQYMQVSFEEVEQEGLLDFIGRHIIEVINGVKAYRLFFKVNYGEEQLRELISKSINKFIGNNYKLPIHIFMRHKKQEVEMCLLPCFNDISSLYIKELDLLHRLKKVEKDDFDIILSQYANSEISDKLHGLSTCHSMTISTLASESLTIQGVPTVPCFVREKGASEIRSCNDDGLGKRSFEDRINVESYDNYELLHPGYARQAPVIAEMIWSLYDKEPEQILDIGTGPGHPLLMLLEFFPDARVIAVDPSPASCACLSRNINEQKIECVQKDLFDIELSQTVPVITSVGASHHFNVAFFFQKVKELLDDNGVLVIADEFVAPFSCQDERNLQLVRHHTAYMLDILASSPGQNIKKRTDNENVLINALEDEIPVLNFEATTGMVDAAVRRAKRLLQIVHGLSLHDPPSHQFVKFYHFIVLELEALVAGLDYEIEQKTYPENFVFLAEYAGFNLQNHKRVYPTIGFGEMDGGTHVFAFSKNTNS